MGRWICVDVRCVEHGSFVLRKYTNNIVLELHQCFPPFFIRNDQQRRTNLYSRSVCLPLWKVVKVVGRKIRQKRGLQSRSRRHHHSLENRVFSFLVSLVSLGTTKTTESNRMCLCCVCVVLCCVDLSRGASPLSSFSLVFRKATRGRKEREKVTWYKANPTIRSIDNNHRIGWVVLQQQQQHDTPHIMVDIGFTAWGALMHCSSWSWKLSFCSCPWAISTNIKEEVEKERRERDKIEVLCCSNMLLSLFSSLTSLRFCLCCRFVVIGVSCRWLRWRGGRGGRGGRWRRRRVWSARGSRRAGLFRVGLLLWYIVLVNKIIECNGFSYREAPSQTEELVLYLTISKNTKQCLF